MSHFCYTNIKTRTLPQISSKLYYTRVSISLVLNRYLFLNILQYILQYIYEAVLQVTFNFNQIMKNGD